jgi:hypothetical protein
MTLTPRDKITLLEQMQASDGYALLVAHLTQHRDKEIAALIGEKDAVEVIRRQTRIQSAQMLLGMPDYLIKQEELKARNQ